MCRFFSGVVTRQGEIFFTESDSHSVVVQRKGFKDNSVHIRHFVRFEKEPSYNNVPKKKTMWGSLRVDETTTPGWFEEDRVEIDGRVEEIAIKVKAAKTGMERAREKANKALWERRREISRKCSISRCPYSIKPGKEVEYQNLLVQANADRDAQVAKINAAFIKRLKKIGGYVPDPAA
jgi:hypothetical protein